MIEDLIVAVMTVMMRKMFLRVASTRKSEDEEAKSKSKAKMVSTS